MQIAVVVSGKASHIDAGFTFGFEAVSHDFSPLGLGFRFASETLPRGEQRGASGVSGFAGNRLHENEVKEDGRKAFRSALGAAPQSLCVSDRHRMAETIGSGRGTRLGRGPKATLKYVIGYS